MPITSVAEDAAWKGTIIPVDVGCAIKCSAHAIMDLHGATRFHFPGDLMHTGSLGVLQYFLGSGLAALVDADTKASRAGNLDFCSQSPR